MIWHFFSVKPMPSLSMSRCYLLLVLLACPLLAQAGLLVPTSTGISDPKILSIREMSIEVGIARGYARVNVRQVFENHTDSIQEGTYRFALPESAAVGDFAIWDALQRIPGVILEKKRARSIYRELTRQRIDPGLLQQGEEEDQASGEGARSARPSGSALFSVKVSPIPAHGTKRLELQFQQEVPFISGQGEFRLELAPPDGEAPIAASLTVNVRLEDGHFEAMTEGLSLKPSADGAQFFGSHVKLDRDLVLRIRPKNLSPLRLSAFRNPDGQLPDGLALAPWERASEIPPEKDGFFLLEAMPKASVIQTDQAAKPQTRKAMKLAILFDTSLGHRWQGLETAYAQLVRALSGLKRDDQFALIPFDHKPGGALLRPASPKDIEAELNALRTRSLGPGCNLGLAIGSARKLLGDSGRILLLSSGQDSVSSKTISGALGLVELFTLVTAGEAREALRNASVQTLAPTATALEVDLFFKRLLEPTPVEKPKTTRAIPFQVTGGDAKLRQIYPVLVQPMEPGSLSAWVGRYAVPQPKLKFTLAMPGGNSNLGGSLSLEAALPEKALEARDLPRRWARARVDDLLARIELEGEKREWVDEIIELSKRYKFITPYTAFLAAPRSLLRPRRIQPGDPVLRVECDPGTLSAKALFPFGLKLDLVRRPGTQTWEGRFLVPEGFPEGRHALRILLRDASGAMLTETKHFILDGTAPQIRAELPASARAGEVVRIQARTDADVVMLNARMGEAPPVPLRWDPEAHCSVGYLRIPEDCHGSQEVLFEAVDAARNRGFARTALEVKP